jgi:hypothetical protein
MNTHTASYNTRIGNLARAGLLTTAEDGGSRLDEDRGDKARRRVWREALY